MYDREEAKAAVGKGWHSLIDEVYDHVSPNVVFSQVKEKFGGLRMYACQASEKDLEFIDSIEDKSLEICEFCGEPGVPVLIRGWVKTLCRLCESKRREV